MEQILLLDTDAEHARQIAAVLGCIPCQTTICVDAQTAVTLLKKRTFDVVLVVAVPKLDWDVQVEFVRHAALQVPEPPQIVCLLRGPYRGPAERVYGARKGFKVMYER